MIDVEKVLINLDVALTAQRGDEVTGYCPMHKARTGKEDHNPSWWINTESGAHICFSCGYKGNIYTLVADLKGISWHDAKEFINQQAEIPVDSLLRRLKELPEYIVPQEEIGMSEARLSVFTEVPDVELKKRFLTRSSANKYGIKWDTKNDSWILPIRDPDTFELLGWQEKGSKGRFFKNQPVGIKKSRTLFGIDVAPDNKQWVIVESPLDAVRLYTLGFIGVATFGAIISEEQAKLMRRASTIVAAFDKDDAGKKACEQMLGFARKYGLELQFFNYGNVEEKDVGDMLSSDVLRGIDKAKDRVWGKKAYL